jgi:hypothetical protein
MRHGSARSGRASGARLAAIGTLLLWSCSGAPPPAPANVPEPGPSPEPDALSTPERPLETSCARIERIEVRKSERTLVAECTDGGRLVFEIALSRAADGPKRALGDWRMPEGDYHVAGPARPSRFHRFLPIDYPSPRDAESGLAEGRIGASEHAAILRAHAEGRLPPQDTALGGHLGFHGEGERWQGDLDLDWTEGCFALRDDAIEVLARAAPPGTPVRIEP